MIGTFLFRLAQNSIFVLLIAICSPFVRGQEIVRSLNGNYTEIQGSKLYYLQVKDGSPEEIIHSKKNDFKSIPNLYPNFGFTKQDVWFRFIVDSSIFGQTDLFLKLGNPNLDKALIYRKNKQGTWRKLALVGDVQPRDSLSVENRDWIIGFKPERKLDTIYIQMNNGGEQFFFVPSIVKRSYFSEEDAENQLFMGIYYGIIVFIFSFNLFSFYFLKERNALWYALYVFFLAGLQISLTGIGNFYLWDGEFFSNRANPFFSSAGLLFLLLFAMDFLRTKVYVPKIHRLFIFTSWAAASFIIASLLPYSWAFDYSVIGVNTLTLVLNTLILPVSIYIWKRGSEIAPLFIVAFSLLILSVFGFILKNFGLVPVNFFTEFGMMIGSASESILLSVGIVLRYKNTRETAIESLEKLNEVTENANKELEVKVRQRTYEVEQQKEQLLYKNQEILDSITYAKRIQEALLPSKHTFAQLLPKSALWYAPKDIVAGDFYWAKEKEIEGEKWTFFAVADCTGHGVPGAMMSVLCINALENALQEINTPNPGDLLERTAAFLATSLETEKQALQDGMDISLCCLNRSNNQLFWAGANNPLWILKGEDMEEITATKRPVGKSEVLIPFTTHEVSVQNGDRIVLFSDGYADQFGGPKNKKLKRKLFKEYTLETHKLDIQDQIKTLKRNYHQWKSDQEQVDDVCVLLVEISE